MTSPPSEINGQSSRGEDEVRRGGNNNNGSPTSLTKKELISGGLIVLAWIALSTSVILFNRNILVDQGFSYPITLTTLHLFYQTCATRILLRFTSLISGKPTYSLLPSNSDSHSTPSTPTTEKSTRIEDVTEMKQVDKMKAWKDTSVEMDWIEYKKIILPPAAMFSISLVLSNWAYLYLSVSYIHILKAFSPVAIVTAAFLFGTKPFSLRLLIIVTIISVGICLASLGEADLSIIGFAIQVIAICVEACRVTLIQILLQGKSEMSPLKCLYYFAPVCLVMNASLIIPFEGLEAVYAIPRLGFSTILFNCTLTFLLNLSAVYLISLSSMVLSLSKVAKDILLVAGSSLLYGASLSPLQIGGYALATFGLFLYKKSSQ